MKIFEISASRKNNFNLVFLWCDLIFGLFVCIYVQVENDISQQKSGNGDVVSNRSTEPVVQNSPAQKSGTFVLYVFIFVQVSNLCTLIEHRTHRCLILLS